MNDIKKKLTACTKCGASPLNADIVNAIPSEFSRRAVAHYAKALRKHPRFADALHDVPSREDAEKELAALRDKLDYANRSPRHVVADDLLRCEMLEAWVALNDEETISELYDAVAVLMRMIAVVEGKQKLGGEK